MEYKNFKINDETIIIPIPQNYSDCIELICSDYYRVKGKKASFIKLWIATLHNYCFRYNFWLRLSSYKGIFFPLCKWMHNRCFLKTGINISPQTPIGYGLYISHGFGIIINPTAVLGNNVNISQFLTIGSNEGKAAVIGNNVYIGPNVCIVENVIVGSNSCIGAGAVVTKNISMGMTAAGVPAKAIGENKHSNYILNKRHYKDR